MLICCKINHTKFLIPRKEPRIFPIWLVEKHSEKIQRSNTHIYMMWICYERISDNLLETWKETVYLCLTWLRSIVKWFSVQTHIFTCGEYVIKYITQTTCQHECMLEISLFDMSRTIAKCFSASNAHILTCCGI